MDLPDAVSASPEIAVPWLIRAEREAAHQGDLVQLDALWAQESRVIDRRGDEDSNRYYIWVGKDAVLNRYVVAVFPHAPPRLAADALDDLTIDTQLGGGADREFDPQNPRTGDIIQAVNGNDEWQFIWQDGRWQILELRYSSY